MDGEVKRLISTEWKYPYDTIFLVNLYLTQTQILIEAGKRDQKNTLLRMMLQS